MTDITIKALVEQQLIVGKLKKQSKILRKSKPVFSLMQCQDIVAQQHGYLHWYELHTGLKRRLTDFTRTSQHHKLGFVKGKNLLLGNDSLLNQNIYLHPDFRKLNISQNGYSNDFIFEVFKETIERQSKFIYCYKEENKKLQTNITNFAQENNIPVYTLSFNEINSYKTLGIHLNTMSAGAITDLFVRSILDVKDLDVEFWLNDIVSMGRSLFMALCYMRDNGEIQLTPTIIDEYFSLDNFIKLYERKDFPKHIHEALKNYLFSLNSFDENLDSYHQNYNVKLHHSRIYEHYFNILSTMKYTCDFVFNNSTLSVSDVLAKKEKFVLMVDLSNRHSSEYETLFSLFFAVFKQSFTNDFNQPEHKKFSYYFFIENLYPNLTLPSKLLSYSINFLLTDRFQPEGININPAKNGIAVK